MSVKVMSTLDFDIRIAFKDFSLDLSHCMPLAGVTALFGPSGSGKSTLLRIFAGLERGASGRIAFAGETWQAGSSNTAMPVHRRGIGYVFQDARLFPHLDVAGNLRFADRRSRHIGGEIDFVRVVAGLDLAPLLARRTSSLSGGERQRVAIGRTLLTRPRLLLMDEPLAALDLKRKAEILPYIETLPRALGIPAIYVTHDIEEVARLADRMIVLHNGRITATGDVESILSRLDLGSDDDRVEPGVALTARVREHDSHYHLTHLDLHGHLLTVPQIDAAIGRSVRLRIRARDVAIATRRPVDISVRNILPVTILEISSFTDVAHADLLMDLSGSRLRARITRQSVDDLRLQPGLAVFAVVKSVAFDSSGFGPNHAP